MPSSGKFLVPAGLEDDLGLWLIKFCVVRGCVLDARRPDGYTGK
jgi:hypothetical protein